jgi:galactose-1-phosphate uridylyltransferase
MNARSQRRLAELEALVASLPRSAREKFDRIFQLSVTSGYLEPPDSMDGWLSRQFGSVDSVRQQRIVRITNRVTLDGALFNALRSQRPLEAPSRSGNAEERLESPGDCSFCNPWACTPADPFGRIQGRHCLTASNVAKYDGWHAVIIFDEHHPLRFTANQVADYLDTAQQWAQRAHQADPGACYPLFLWNCLWRSGASILHGHAQMVLGRNAHYGKVEQWRQAALRYHQTYGADYFADIVAVHRALHLAVEHGSATIIPSLTPFKERETLIIATQMGDDLKCAIYHLLATLVRRLGMQSFNLALYQPPLGDVPENWQGFPFVVRVLDRGSLQSTTTDIGAMEIFAQSVVVSDPFDVSEALRDESLEVL